ncbi:MAG: S8 family peptidase [Anaerovoracaceae bacterium]
MKKRSSIAVAMILSVILVLAAPSVASAKSYKTNDPGFNKAYHISEVGAVKSWNFIKRINKVRVAVLDTGVNINHPDLQKSLNKSLSVDVTGNRPTKLTSDLTDHGTHVAGIIGATANNKKGLVGIASGEDNNISEIIMVKVFNKKENGDVVTKTSSIVKGIDYAIANGAEVINLSLGFKKDNPALKAAVDKAYNAGITVVAAAGNNNSRAAYYPADYSSTISVASVDKSNKKSSFSNFGDEDIAAPGNYIYSTAGNGYGYKSGTSMSTAMVTATVANMLATNPTLSPDQIRNILTETAKPFSKSRNSSSLGQGVLNTAAAVKAAQN